jgi:ATP-dependent RNA helicase SUPV3L1/SUV3
MCAHPSGMIGFPLRLLAREVYERVVALKGAAQVALMTGEEKIIPENARYFLCTAESMPVPDGRTREGHLARDVSFLALDEAQVATDDERGHIFTDRLLRARGRDETMILGSESLRPLIQRLLPGAEIITRPRFSTLSFAAAKKLSRLPKRSAIVAFTAEEVYAIAEMLRRHRGGAAVVMGALSPRTRNAQVAMYQNGEVDYLVATDAIGMGLNMDIAHVAFGGLGKFDGRRRRRLTISEMAQIAGRAGRHHKDGSFGVVQLGETARSDFEADEILAIESHTFQPLTELKWRNPDLSFASMESLIGSLEVRPHISGLTRTDETIDLAVLRLLSMDPVIADRARDNYLLRRLWAACQLSDYQKTAAEQHGRLVSRLFQHLSQGKMTIPGDLIAAEVARLDNMNGDIDTLSNRIAAMRTWTYVSHQADWLDDPAHWAARTRALEDKLSDSLHERLTQRFVDRRTSILLRGLKQQDATDIKVSASGSVEVDGAEIGTVSGFTFTADPAARHSEKRMVMAAAERALTQEFGRRVKVLRDDAAQEFALVYDGTDAPRIQWRGQDVATLGTGRDMLSPRILPLRGTQILSAVEKEQIARRLKDWLASQLQRHLKPLMDLSDLAERLSDQGGFSAAGRGLAVQLIESGGCLSRIAVEDLILALTPDDRKLLRQTGVRLGMVHVFAQALLKPEATRWRLALLSLDHERLNHQKLAPSLFWSGRVSLPLDRKVARQLCISAGFWPVGQKAVRVDMVERIADDVREAGKKRSAFVPPENLMSMVGLTREEFAGLMGALGYRRRMINPASAANDSPALETPETAQPVTALDDPAPVPPAQIIAFQWKGHMTKHRPSVRPASTPTLPLESGKRSAATSSTARLAGSPFAALASLKVVR